MITTLPLTNVQLKATEARLMRVYDAAKLGLKGDSLALAAGMRPEDFYRLCEMDELVELAIKKARADSEMGAARTLYRAADEGDAKAALEILRHQHEWVAKQQVQVDVNQQISITAALQEAERRVIDADTDLLSSRRAGADGQALVSEAKERPAGVRDVRVPVESQGDATRTL